MTKKITIDQAVEEVQYMIDHCLPPKERKSVTDFRVSRLRRAIEIMRWTQENEPVIRQWHDEVKKKETIVCSVTAEQLNELREWVRGVQHGQEERGRGDPDGESDLGDHLPEESEHGDECPSQGDGDGHPRL